MRCSTLTTMFSTRLTPRKLGSKSHMVPSRGTARETRPASGLPFTRARTKKNAASAPAPASTTVHRPITHSGTPTGFASVAPACSRRSVNPATRRRAQVRAMHSRAPTAARFAA